MTYNKEYAKEYYLLNKDRMLANNAKWQEANRDKMREYSKKYKSSKNPTFVKYCEDNYEQWILNSAKRNAKEQDLAFDLELSDIIIPEICPYLGHVLTKVRGAGQLETNASIDKIDPTKGYVKGNVQIISRQANRMKNNATSEQLILFAKNILKLEQNRESDIDD